MRVILLCGGAGTRFTNVYPKPMNLVNGIPMIKHVIENFHTKEIICVYNFQLDGVGFIQYLKNEFKEINFQFIRVDFQTRGPAETLLIGIKSLQCSPDEQILVLDNDNIYEGLDLTSMPKGNFIIYNDNPTGLSHYSFVTVENDVINAIEERKNISPFVCMGGYGFESLAVCREYCKRIVFLADTEAEHAEPYLSIVFKAMISDGLRVHGSYLPKSFSIGTEKDIILNSSKLKHKKLRVVFDLDNTLVSYPNTRRESDNLKDYRDVDPISHITEFCKYLKMKGHEVIIYTARHTLSCGHNIGKVVKNIGFDTLKSLHDLGIEYDEIYFGKPYGDIYIDDKAFNTYDIELFRQIGFYDASANGKMQLQNYKTNRYNLISRIDRTTLRKTGPNLSGEIFYYSIVASSVVSDLFPAIISTENDNTLYMEFVQGTTLSKLYFEGLLQPSLLCRLIDTLHRLHSSDVQDGVALTDVDAHAHYLHKFESRSVVLKDYPFPDFEDVYKTIKAQVHAFLQQARPFCVIHGDSWFSNIMISKKKLKFIDMRGKFNDRFSIRGHAVYDWAKLLQSLLGLDGIIDHGQLIDENVRQDAVQTFWAHLVGRNIITESEKTTVERLTGYLIYNTFHAYEPDFPSQKKKLIWDLVKACIY